MRTIRAVRGIAVEAIGEGWAAFSPLSGETVVLNNEAAAVLESLQQSAHSVGDVVAMIASDTGMAAGELVSLVDDAVSQLADAGLVERESSDGSIGVSAAKG